MLSTHMMLAHLTQIAEIQLHPEEARAVAQAASNVMRHYDVRTTQKTMDWGNLLIALGTVYGPRVVVIAANRRQQAKPPPQGPAAPETGWGEIGQLPDATPTEPPIH